MAPPHTVKCVLQRGQAPEFQSNRFCWTPLNESHVLSINYFTLKKKFFFLSFKELGTEQRERKRESQADSLLSAEPDMGFHLTGLHLKDPEIHDLSRNQESDA